MLSSGIRIRNSGTQSETTRASKTNMIKTCFSVVENKLAEAGNKEIFLRITNEDGILLEAPTPLSIKDKDQKKINKLKRTINYQNENTDLCIYYEVDNSIEANYKIEICRRISNW